MKILLFRLLLIYSILLSSLAIANPDAPYLFELLKNPTNKRTFSDLFKSERNIEPWLKRYIKNRNGVDSPREYLELGSITYELYHVCKPHNCPYNDLYVLFSKDGKQAWALFSKDDGSTRFFGKPLVDIQQTLMDIKEKNDSRL